MHVLSFYFHIVELPCMLVYIERKCTCISLTVFLLDCTFLYWFLTCETILGTVGNIHPRSCSEPFCLLVSTGLLWAGQGAPEVSCQGAQEPGGCPADVRDTGCQGDPAGTGGQDPRDQMKPARPPTVRVERGRGEILTAQGLTFGGRTALEWLWLGSEVTVSGLPACIHKVSYCLSVTVLSRHAGYPVINL